jgi:dipeptidyl aminopeptidase/acylaminoacyl peptidase
MDRTARARYVKALLLACALAGGSSGIAAARPWTLADAAKLPYVDDVQLSPNGKTALIEMESTDLSHDAFGTSYRSVSLATGTIASMPLELTHPRWSPDSQHIAWLAQRGHSVAIAITDADGRRRKTLSALGRDVVAFSWSPDGRTIAAIESSGSNVTAGRLAWLDLESDYRGTRPPRRSVWLIEVTTGLQREITRDTWSYGGPVTDHDPSWSDDGTRIAVVRQPTPLYGDFEHVQYVTLDLRSGSISQIITHPFFAYPASAPPVFGPGGSIAYAQTWDGNLAAREDVYVNGRDVSAALDRDLWSCSAGSFTWRPPLLIATLMDGVAVRLFSLDPKGTLAPAALTPDAGSVVAYSIARDGTIAYLWTAPQTLPELYVREPNGGTRQVTHLFPIPSDLSIAATRTFTWNSGGRKLHGLLTIPPRLPASTAPLIVEPHGGPQCAEAIGFNGIAQYLASRGYAYFRPDPPGSDGYGDWSYKAIVGNWGDVPMRADMDGVDALFAARIGDPARSFIEGGSYGGYLTSWIVTHTQRFRAAVAEVPVTDLELDYALSESPNITRRFFGAAPSRNPELLAQQSPLRYVAQERTPLLLIVGLRDTRAPYVQAIEFYKALYENGAPVRLLADPDAGHGPNDPTGFMAWWSATAAWFAQYGGIAIPDARLPR